MLSKHSPFYHPHCIDCRLPLNACPCAQLTNHSLPFLINICSHPNEWRRNNNTAQWAVLSSADITRYRWHRKPVRMQPMLPTSINHSHTTSLQGHYLLYPNENSRDIRTLAQETSAINEITHEADNVPHHPATIKQLWVIDGTWQEAQKMFNQSPWLQQLPTLHISDRSSQFTLRRNQQGLSTMEAMIAAIEDYAPNSTSAEGFKHNFTLLQNRLMGLLR